MTLSGGGRLHPNKINFLAAECTKNTGQTTFEGGEGGGGDDS